MRCALLVAVSVVLFALPYCGARVTRDLSPDKLHKNYAKINKYLENNVELEDPKINMAKAVQLLNEKSSSTKCFNIGGKSSLVDALSMLQDFADTPSLSSFCTTYRRNELLNTIDSGLGDESRLRTPNYPLSRIDRIIQHYAIEDALRCAYTHGFPKMNFGYMQNAYDEINKRLISALPKVDNVYANMEKVASWLYNMLPTDGALAEAMKQLLRLESTLNEDTCNEKGYEIILRNDLATRHELIEDKPLRRVSKIVQYFAKRHEQICRPIAPTVIKSELKRLDQDSFRLVLGLVCSHNLDRSEFGKLVEELNAKQVDEDFSTSLLVEHVTQEIGKHDGKFAYSLEHDSPIDPETLYFYVAAASTKDPLSLCIHGTMKNMPKSGIAGMRAYEIRGKKTFDVMKLQMLLAKYLFEPCRRFINVLGGQVKADDYGVNVNRSHADSYGDEFIQEMSYHTIRSGYFACEFVLNKREIVLEGIMDASSKH